jgi:hypothetical protein
MGGETNWAVNRATSSGTQGNAPIAGLRYDSYGQRKALTIGSSDHGAHLRCAKEGVDDWDKPASFVVDATPRRSTSSLDGI